MPRARDSRGRFVSTNVGGTTHFVPVTVEDVRETVREVYGGNPDARWSYDLPTQSVRPPSPPPAQAYDELCYIGRNGARRVQRSRNGRFTLGRAAYHRQTPQWRAEIERNFTLGLDARGRYTITVRPPAEVRDRTTSPPAAHRLPRYVTVHDSDPTPPPWQEEAELLSSTPPPIYVLQYQDQDGTIRELRSPLGRFTLSPNTWFRQTPEWREDAYRRYSMLEDMNGHYILSVRDADLPAPPPTPSPRITQAPPGSTPRIEIASDRRMMVVLQDGTAVWFAPYDNTPILGRQVYRLTNVLWAQLGWTVQDMLLQYFELNGVLTGDLELRQRETPLPTPRPTLPMPLASFEALTTAERDSLQREYGPLTCHLRPDGEGGEATWVEAAAAFNTARVRWVPETSDAEAYQNPNLSSRLYSYALDNIEVSRYGQEIYFNNSMWYMKVGIGRKNWLDPHQWVCPVQKAFPFWDFDGKEVCEIKYMNENPLIKKKLTPLQKYKEKLDRNIETRSIAQRIQEERRRQIEERRQRRERRAAGRNGTRRRGRRLRTPAPPPGSVAPYDEEFISTATINA